MKEYTEIERDAIREIDKFDVDDYLAFGPNYFSCGWKKNTYYNYNYAVALALIGHFYGDEDCSNSDYHKGVKYIADAVGVSNRMVKILIVFLFSEDLRTREIQVKIFIIAALIALFMILACS